LGQGSLGFCGFCNITRKTLLNLRARIIEIAADLT